MKAVRSDFLKVLDGTDYYKTVPFAEQFKVFDQTIQALWKFGITLQEIFGIIDACIVFYFLVSHGGTLVQATTVDFSRLFTGPDVARQDPAELAQTSDRLQEIQNKAIEAVVERFVILFHPSFSKPSEADRGLAQSSLAKKPKLAVPKVLIDTILRDRDIRTIDRDAYKNNLDRSIFESHESYWARLNTDQYKQSLRVVLSEMSGSMVSLKFPLPLEFQDLIVSLQTCFNF